MARVLILGGSGFIGRHLVEFLYNSKNASKVCVADKVPFSIAGLSEQQNEIFTNKDFVAFKQADLKNSAHVEAVFEFDGGNWEYVINLAAVTKYSQAKEVYEANIVQVSTECAKVAAAKKVKRYIEVSTAQVYDGGKKVAKESDKNRIKPWTGIGAASLAAEQAVAGTSGLNYVIVRPAVVYGPSDIYGMTPRLIVGSIYKQTEKKMESLYTKDLRFNTVHVRDVAKALWFLCSNGDCGETFNLADPNDTNAGKVNQIIEQVFGIKTSFLNPVKMSLASKMGTKYLVSYANDTHLKPFSDACKKFNIMDTPLTPYLDEELIKEMSIAVDGKKITGLGFEYSIPAPTKENCTEVLQDFIDKKYFPKEMLGN